MNYLEARNWIFVLHDEQYTKLLRHISKRKKRKEESRSEIKRSKMKLEN